jgi:ACS family glucarate transporter-like MFS transporter
VFDNYKPEINPFIIRVIKSLRTGLDTTGESLKSAETKAGSHESRSNTNPSLKDSSQRWWLMVLLVAAMIICYAHRAALSVAAPFMMKELHLSPAVMGILLSAFFWSYSLMQMPAGWLVDRFGVKRTYAFGYAFWSIASALTGFATNLITLIVVRMFLGIGQAVAFPASARAVANWFQEKERGTVTASYLTGVRLGQALVAGIAVFFLSTYGFKAFFLATGLIPALWLVPWLQFLGKWEKGTAKSVLGSSEPTQPSLSPGSLLKAANRPDEGARVPNSREPRTSSHLHSAPVAIPATVPKKGTSFLQSLILLKHRSVFGIFLGFFAYDYAWFVYVTWLPGYLVMEREFSAREMGIYSSVPYIAMSGIILLSGLMSDGLIRRGYSETAVRKAFIIVGLVVGCLIVPAGLVEDKMTAVWLLSISLCGLGICSPNTWTLTQAVCSRSIVGTVSGIQNFGGNVGGILAPVLTGYIAHMTQSFALALSITGVVLVIGILAYSLLISQRVEMEEK